MAIRIEDGKGNGYTASVTSRNKLLTEAYTRDAIVEESGSGRAYCISSGFISLTTTGSYNGILYLYNDSEHHFHLDRIVSSVTASVAKIKVVKNPTAGTLISGGTSLSPVNMNFASGETFTGTATYGADALTVTNGTDIALVAVQNQTELSATRGMMISKGNSIAIVAQPLASLEVCVTITGFYHQHSE